MCLLSLRLRSACRQNTLILLRLSSWAPDSSSASCSSVTTCSSCGPGCPSACWRPLMSTGRNQWQLLHRLCHFFLSFAPVSFPLSAMLDWLSPWLWGEQDVHYFKQTAQQLHQWLQWEHSKRTVTCGTACFSSCYLSQWLVRSTTRGLQRTPDTTVTLLADTMPLFNTNISTLCDYFYISTVIYRDCGGINNTTNSRFIKLAFCFCLNSLIALHVMSLGFCLVFHLIFVHFSKM